MSNRLREFLQYFSDHKPAIKKATLFSVVNKLFDIAPEVLIGVAVDIVVRREASFVAQLGFETPTQQLFFLAVLTFIIWVCESVFEYLYSIEWRNIAQRIQHQLRLRAYGHIQNMDMMALENENTGRLMAILNDDVNQLERFLNQGLSHIVQIFTAVLVIGLIFLIVSPQVALFAMAPMPFILAGAFYFQRKLAPLYARVRSQAGDINSRLSNNLSGMSVVKSYTSEDFELGRLERDSQAYLIANRDAIRTSSAFVPIIRMGVLFGFMVTLCYGGFLTLEGQLPVGSYGILVFLTQRLLWPLTDLANVFNDYERSMASFSRVKSLLDTKPQIVGGTLGSEHIHEGVIAFQNLSFAYPGHPPLFQHFSLSVPSGKMTAFVGTTGSGKTTLIKMLLRFVDAHEGQILVDGQDVTQFSLSGLRQEIGLVSQDVFLFQGSIAENIAYAKPGASDHDIEKAARAAEAHDFIVSLPQGYESQVGEKGVKLSGGQRQRISIARAILKDPKILVFDEATSAVDNETELAIQKSLARVSKNRTTLVVAHRLSTIRHAHQIIVLEQGDMVEVGTHEELVARDGVYSKLWKLQTGALIEEFAEP